MFTTEAKSFGRNGCVGCFASTGCIGGSLCVTSMVAMIAEAAVAAGASAAAMLAVIAGAVVAARTLVAVVAAGLLWQQGCCGNRGCRGYCDRKATVTAVAGGLLLGLYSQHFIFYLTYEWAKRAGVFVPDKPFQPNVM